MIQLYQILWQQNGVNDLAGDHDSVNENIRFKTAFTKIKFFWL